jgi:hypothetical protein
MVGPAGHSPYAKTMFARLPDDAYGAKSLVAAFLDMVSFSRARESQVLRGKDSWTDYLATHGLDSTFLLRLGSPLCVSLIHDGWAPGMADVTLFELACVRGHLPVVEYFVRDEARVVDLPFRGQHLAAYAGQRAVLRLLIEHQGVVSSPPFVAKHLSGLPTSEDFAALASGRLPARRVQLADLARVHRVLLAGTGRPTSGVEAEDLLRALCWVANVRERMLACRCTRMLLGEMGAACTERAAVPCGLGTTATAADGLGPSATTPAEGGRSGVAPCCQAAAADGSA